MKMCKNCHQVVNENEIFCHNCGFNEFDYITLQSEEERKKLPCPKLVPIPGEGCVSPTPARL